jgi:hypothetical protein
MRGLDPRIHLLCNKSYEVGLIAGQARKRRSAFRYECAPSCEVESACHRLGLLPPPLAGEGGEGGVAAARGMFHGRAERLSIECDQAQRLAVGLVLQSGEKAGRIAGSGGRQFDDDVELGHRVRLIHAQIVDVATRDFGSNESSEILRTGRLESGPLDRAGFVAFQIGELCFLDFHPEIVQRHWR